MSIIDFRICLADTHDAAYKYLYCKYCHNIIRVTPPKMALTRLDGDMSKVILLDTEMKVNLRCKCSQCSYVEIHENTVDAHKTCADSGISIYYDYGEVTSYNQDMITRNWKGDRPIFKFPSLEILDIESEDGVRKLFELIPAYKNKLAIKQIPGYCGGKVYTKFEAIIRTGMAKDTDELCSDEYFNKMNREINDARTYMEQIINRLIIAVT